MRRSAEMLMVNSVRRQRRWHPKTTYNASDYNELGLGV